MTTNRKIRNYDQLAEAIRKDSEAAADGQDIPATTLVISRPEPSFCATGLKYADGKNATFAQGYDAKLVGMVARVAAAGGQIHYYGPDGAKREVVDPFEYLGRVGSDALVRKARTAKDALVNRCVAAKERAERKAARDEGKVEKVTAKVGRWEREGTLSANGKKFTYVDAKGDRKVTDKFKLVEG